MLDARQPMAKTGEPYREMVETVQPLDHPVTPLETLNLPSDIQAPSTLTYSLDSATAS